MKNIPKRDIFYIISPVSDEEPTGSERSAREVKGAQQNHQERM